jgi:hypothetical protein
MVDLVTNLLTQTAALLDPSKLKPRRVISSAAMLKCLADPRIRHLLSLRANAPFSAAHDNVSFSV